MRTITVTVELPAELLKHARSATGDNITNTIRRGLVMVAATPVQERLVALRGKVRFSINLRTLRNDRD